MALKLYKMILWLKEILREDYSKSTSYLIKINIYIIQYKRYL